MKKQKVYLIEEIIYWIVLLIVGIGFIAFYKEFLFTNYDNVAHRVFAERLFNTKFEDMLQYHSEMPIIAITYPLYHITLKVVARFNNWDYFFASYMVLSVVNILSMVLFRHLMHKIYKAEKIIERVLINFVSIGAILFVVARSPLTDWRFYDIQCAANAVHNPTVLFVRPFGILTFIVFCLIITKLEKGVKCGKELVFFGIISFVSVLAKPNFAYAFLPAMGVVTLIFMIQKKTLKKGLLLLGAVIPSVVLLLVQISYFSVFSGVVKVSFAFGGFTGLNLIEIIMVSIATFPVVLILFSMKDFKTNVYYRTAILALVFGWLQMFLLTNGPTGDFSWSYGLSVQFATVISIVCAMKSTMPRWRKIIGYLVFAYQTLCGIQYIFLVSEYGQFLI